MTEYEEILKMFDEQYREIIDRCSVEGNFNNKSAVEFLHMGVMYFIKQYQYQESIEDLLSAYLGIAGDIIDDVIYDHPDNHDNQATHVQVTSSTTTPEQKEIDRALKAEHGRGYEKDIIFSHDYTPEFEVQETLFEKITVDTDAEGPIYPPLKAFSKQREEEVRKALYSMLIEKFPLDKIDLSIIGLYNEFVSILTFFEDNRDSFSRSITRGYFTTPHGRKHNLYIDAINATNLPTPDNIRAKYRYTVNGSKVYYQFRIERQDLVEEFTLGKDENKEIAEIVEYRFDDGQRSITINLNRFASTKNIGQLSQFFLELVQGFDRRFNQR